MSWWLRATGFSVACTALLLSSASAAQLAVAGRIVFGAGDWQNSHIYTVSSDGAGLRKLTHGPQRDSDPVWSPDGSQIAFLRYFSIGQDWRGDLVYRTDIFIMDADGGRSQRLVQGADDPVWSPDGKRILFRRGEKIWVTTRDGTRARRLAVGSQPDWSPDGRQIAFERWTGDFSETFMIRDDGTGLRKLVRQRVESNSPAWSPNGSSVCFFGDWEDYVYVVGANGRALTKIALFIGETENPPAWSPDAKRVAFARYLDTHNSPNNEFIYAARANGSGARRLAGPRASDPEWSSDGRRIAFVRGNDSIRVMNADGTSMRTIAKLNGITGIDWSG